jgi:hypothetical protein
LSAQLRDAAARIQLLEQQKGTLHHELGVALEALVIMQEELQKVHEVHPRAGR